MKKITQEEFNEMKKDVEEKHPLKELSGIYEAVLHLTQVIKFLVSEEGKKLTIDEIGDIKYDVCLDLNRKSLAQRKSELKFLEASLVKK